MTMPEATVNQNHGAVLWQDNVRTARQSGTVEAEPETMPMKE
jgi:hypothetical protein